MSRRGKRGGSDRERGGALSAARAVTAIGVRSSRERRDRELSVLVRFLESVNRAATEEELVSIIQESLRPLIRCDRLALAIADGDLLNLRAVPSAAATDSASRVGETMTIPLRSGRRTEGAFLVAGGPFRRRDVVLLNTLAGFVASTIVRLRNDKALRQTIGRLKTFSAELEVLATADALTGIANRRAFDTALQNEWRRAIRFGSTISLLLIDIDHFKDFNDGLGHVAGDQCLRLLATLLASSVRRAGDFVARIGGEEFAVILPGTPPEAAELLANGLCAAVRRQAVEHPGSPISAHVTVSVGVASTRAARGSSPGELYAAADAALYRAKGAGRDSVSR